MSVSIGFERAFARLVADLRDHGMPSARNLLVTAFGDAIRPYDSAVSVGSLAAVLEPLGVNERLVRTSLTRLVGEEILTTNRVGRRSFYGIHPAATSMFERAEQRIYHHPGREWDGMWTLVVIDAGVGTAKQRAVLRRELGWLGLGPVAPNVLASPVVPIGAVLDAVDHAGPFDGLLITRSSTVEAATTLSDAELAQRCAPVESLAERYDEVRGWFVPVTAALEAGAVLDPALSLATRVLLIACYRRVVLSDPLLPVALLPGSWSGHQTYDRVGELYRRLLPSSERRLAEVSVTDAGPLPRVVEAPSRFAR